VRTTKSTVAKASKETDYPVEKHWNPGWKTLA